MFVTVSRLLLAHTQHVLYSFVNRIFTAFHDLFYHFTAHASLFLINLYWILYRVIHPECYPGTHSHQG